jgi:hypothetical protein
MYLAHCFFLARIIRADISALGLLERATTTPHQKALVAATARTLVVTWLKYYSVYDMLAAF